MKQHSNSKTNLTKRPLSFTEAAFLAHNLETIEHMRNQQDKANKEAAKKAAENADKPLSLGGKIISCLIILPLLYGAGSIVFAVLSVVFDLLF